MERRKLFSDRKPKERRKLFSTTTPEERTIKLFSESAEEEIFQRSLSRTDNEYELKLKEYSGKELTAEEYSNAGFGENELERGFAEINDSGNYKISESAFLESRLFSKITISVTKTLELDPEVMSQPKSLVINKLEGGGKFSPKIIMLLKKAHGIPDDSSENYIKDSGIANDLPIEFGGKEIDKPEFEKIINERYEDAPTDIMDILKNKGVIKVDGEKVEIIK